MKHLMRQQQAVPEKSGEVQPVPTRVPAATPPELPLRRTEVPWLILRSIHLIIIAALLVAGVTYFVSKQISPTYRASATISVTVPPAAGASDAITASNNLASQYVELVTTPAVINAAASRLGLAPSSLQPHVSAGTVSAQNLVSISVEAASAAAAANRANTVAVAFVDFMRRTNFAQTRSYTSALVKGLGIQRAISAAQTAVSHYQRLLSGAAAAQQPALETQLSAADARLATLQAAQQSESLSIAENAAAAQPSLQLLGQAGAGSLVAPRPALYAIIAVIVTLLVAAQLVIVFRRRT